ncbi:MAG: plasmid pRiA4b ORF-3 family protein [Nocardioidaceae bacterium]|nr:plasmid pRiA4b ORF-3 family protein [Nocardioidaceae bacterium]
MLYREPNALQIRVSLSEIEPVIWRRLVLPWAWHLGQLHLVIQAAFNWWNYHLHEFEIGGLRYSDPTLVNEPDFDDECRSFDEREVRLLDFRRSPGARFGYLYDLGDSWRHTVEIEELLSLDPVPRVASCTHGARARPPEDVGGPGGYDNFLQTMADPDHPEHAHTKRWCGGHFDPEWFDLAVTDKDVKNTLKTNIRRRLYQPKPKRHRPS